MANKVKKLTAKEAQLLLEDIRTSCAAAAKQESSEDAGDFTIESLARVLGKDWARTKVEVE